MTWMIDKNIRSETKAKNAIAEAKGRENFYADYVLSDNPYAKNSKQFLAWAYGFIDARKQFEIDNS